MNPIFRALAVLFATCGAMAGAHGHDSLCGTIADAFAAEAAGLAREWVVQVPIDSSAWRLAHVVVADGLVVAQSGDGGVTAIAATPQGSPPAPPGTVLWSQRFGRPGRTISPAAVGSTIVAVSDDLRILGLDRAVGQVRWEEPIAFPLAVGAASSGAWFYAPLEGNGVMRLAENPSKKQVMEEVTPPPGAKKRRGRKTERRLSESVQPRSIDAGGSINMPPVRYRDGVAWCTADGELIVLVRDETEWQRHEFSLDAAPAGPLAVRGDMLFVTTTAGDVAAVEMAAFGLRTKWHTRLAEIPAGTALFAGDMLVVPLAAGGAVGIDAANGRQRWRSDAVGTPLAADATRLWCFDTTARLAVFDPQTGTRLAWFCTGPFTLPVVNTATDRLVLASPKGVIVSLAPRPAAAVTAQHARAPASADPAATPPAANRKAADPSE